MLRVAVWYLYTFSEELCCTYIHFPVDTGVCSALYCCLICANSSYIEDGTGVCAVHTPATASGT